MTGKDLQQRLRARLSQKYDEGEAHSIARILLEDVVGISPEELALGKPLNLGDDIKKRLARVIKRVEVFEPIQYITGIAHFYNGIFNVNPSTLIPRPETEELVDKIVHDNSGRDSLKILDLGTGSGCIAISLARELPGSQVAGADISDEILATANANAVLNGVQLHWIKSDLLLEPIPMGDWDIIVSNPPYIRTSERVEMSRNVLEYEPETALFVPDSSPLVFYKAIAKKALRSLESGGLVYCEINEFLGKETLEVFIQSGYQNCEIFKDMQGKDRMLKAVKP